MWPRTLKNYSPHTGLCFAGHQARRIRIRTVPTGLVKLALTAKKTGSGLPPTRLRGQMFKIYRGERVEKVGKRVIWLRLPSMDICYSRDGWQFNLLFSLESQGNPKPVSRLPLGFRSFVLALQKILYPYRISVVRKADSEHGLSLPNPE